MKNKTHTVTLRLNDLEYEYLNKLLEHRKQYDDFERYTQSDILRLALGYMIDIEYWNSRTTKVNVEKMKKQNEYAKAYWERKSSL